MASINGFTYHQPQPFDLPGPDGPKDPEWIGAEFGRRTERRGAGHRGPHLARGDPSLGRGAEAGVDRSPPRARRRPGRARATRSSQAHIEACIEPRDRDGVPAPPPQHARARSRSVTSCSTRPAWSGRPPTSLLSVFDGHSPVSSVVQPEMQPALDALRKDDDARALLFSGGDAGRGARAAAGRGSPRWRSTSTRCTSACSRASTSRTPPSASGRSASSAGCRPRSTSMPTRRCGGPMPWPPTSARPCRRSTGRRSTTCSAEARLVYRLRDERGLYSEISAVGLLRLALLELGRRLQERGRRAGGRRRARGERRRARRRCSPEPAAPTAEELHQRAIDRVERTLAGRAAPPRRSAAASAAGRPAPAAARPGDVGDRVPHRWHPRPEGGAGG